MYLSIKKRLILLSAAMTIMLILGGIGIIFLNKNTALLYTEINSKTELTVLFKDRFLDHIKWMNLLLESITTRTVFNGETDETKCKFGKWYYSIKSSQADFNQKQKELFKYIELHHTALHRSAENIKNSKNPEKALIIYTTETTTAVAALQKLFEDFITENRNIESMLKSQSDTYMVMVFFIIAGSILFISIVAGAGTLSISKRINRSIAVLEKGIYNFSSGDLSIPLDTRMINCSEIRKCGKTDCSVYGQVTDSCFLAVGSYAPLVKNTITCPSILKGKFKDCRECSVMNLIARDEIEFVVILLNHFRERISRLLKQVIDMLFQMASGSEQMSASINKFSENAQNQAATVEEISATVEEISAGFENITAGAEDQSVKLINLIGRMKKLTEDVTALNNQTRDTVAQIEDMSRSARSSSDSMSLMNTRMEKISTSSKEMTNIIQIIDDISEQINLLSLNASIEAARAGDAGRGFAVVADEVSKLADATASSLKNIQSLIRDNESEINDGINLVSGTVDAFGAIISGVSIVNQMMDKISHKMKEQSDFNNNVFEEAGFIQSRAEEIKSATGEQKTAFDEIVDSINNINDLIQANAAGAEELSAGSEELAGLADSVKREIDFFKV